MHENGLCATKDTFCWVWPILMNNIRLSPCLFALFVSLMWPCQSGRAFPPSPYYTLYGMIRDQVGQTVTAENAVLLLLKNDQEVDRAPVLTGTRIDENYELRMRVDMMRPGTVIYDQTAIGSSSVYSLAVLMDGQRYYPIETNGTLTAGKGGERVRLDLNLGIDSDGDGIPDIWEEWQLFQAGYSPNGSGQWPINLISRNGDLDKDGVSDWLEYIAGTFAGDATDKLSMLVKERLTTQVKLEMYVIAGKFYRIERSTDLITWSPVAIRPELPDAAATGLYQATDIGVLPVYVDTMAVNEFYRLSVR